MLAMGPRDLNSAPYSPVHCSSHSMTSFQSSELTELPVVENSQLFAQRAHSARTAHGTPPHYTAIVAIHLLRHLNTHPIALRPQSAYWDAYAAVLGPQSGILAMHPLPDLGVKHWDRWPMPHTFACCHET